ncbi:hypothetical protein [Bifidobacterium primatium]|uniref:hypothetical protein n=1 Tax=Bifidobacterium primatium TaxID=2045438 RepID=UPI001054C698|nr:hypothetical protein [Bifidobacterium primatium]
MTQRDFSTSTNVRSVKGGIVRMAIAGMAAVAMAAPFITPVSANAATETATTTTVAASTKATAGAFTADGKTFDSFTDALAAAAKADDKTVTITESTDASLSVANTYEGITVTAAKGVVFSGSLRVNASKATVKNMTFKLDPATSKNAQNLIVSGKAAGVTITGNTFEIAAGDPANGASKNPDWQPSSVWLENGANGTVISKNTFKLGQVVNNSAVGVNIVGNGTNPITGTKITNNTVTSGPISGEGKSGSMMFVVGNGNTQAGSYGITDTTISGNIVKNETGLSASTSRTYAFAVTATKNTVIDDNTVEGYAAVSYSVWPSQGPNDGLKVTNNTLDAFAGVLMGSYVTEGGLTVDGNTFGKNTQYAYNGNTTYAVNQDGKAYSSVAKAIETGATTVKLLQNVTEDVTIPAGKTVTIDLAGFTLTNKAGHTITNKGTLTVKDSSAKKTGVIDNVTHQKAALYNEEGATATLDGGKFKRSKETGTADNTFYTILNHGDMTINDGTTVELLLSDGKPAGYSSLIDNGYYSGKPANGKNATMVINGGTFDGGRYVKNDSYGDMTINGGTFKNGASDAVLNWHHLTINGGSFDPADSASGILLNGKVYKGSEDGVATITGGEFTLTGSQKVVVLPAASGPSQGSENVTISGGTYAGVKPEAKYIIKSSGLTTNEDGTFGVKKAVLTLGTTSVKHDVAKGELTADAITTLVAPSVNVEGYTISADEQQLAAINEAIKAGRTGDFELKFNAVKEGATEATITTLTETATVTLTKAEEPAPNPEPSDKPSDNGGAAKPSAKPTTPSSNPTTTTGNNANGTNANRLGKTGTAIAGISAVAIALLAAGGITIAVRRRKA